MKAVLGLFVLIVMAATVTSEITVSDEEWLAFKTKYQKKYDDPTEDAKRRQTYLKTKISVEEHNKKYEAGETTFTMGINHFSDITDEEFEAMRGVPPGDPKP